jgi:outer membrane protein OmpA-like peptidoglycan-associated protein
VSRVPQLLRRRGGAARSRSSAEDAKIEREATQEGGRLTSPGGTDLSQVRLHTDVDASRQADALGARAFALGQDIYFGAGQFAPQAPAGMQLLAHELGHVRQQAQHGPGPQYQPKAQKAGIGAQPPEEDFIKDSDNWGAEDDKVLFENDDAALDGGDEEALGKLAAQQTQAVYVHVHGYASKEGPADYNLNLSAHRGVAVKHLLETLLPAGSRVFVFAHGESRHFGATESNRRAGISMMGPVAEGGFKPRLSLGMRFDLSPPALPGTTPGVVVVPGPGLGAGFRSGLGPGSVLPGGGGGQPPTPWLTVPPTPTTPRHLMDSAALLAPSAFHGVSPGATGNVVEQWDAAYWKYHALGIPDEVKIGPVDVGAGALANKEVTNSIKAYHERNDPTMIERSNQEVGAHIITSPNLLDLFSKKKKKKDAK